MEGTGLVGQGGEDDTNVNVDAESWSRLEPAICEKILEKLPYLERLRLRIVCKDWNCSALERVKRKPYFVIMVKPFRPWRLNGLVAYDSFSKSLSFEELPFRIHGSSDKPSLAPFAMEGMIFSNRPKVAEEVNYKLLMSDHLQDPGQDEWCVYNIHARTMHVLPRAPGSGSMSRRYFCGMMVDTSIKPYSFKLVVCYSDGEESQIYDSTSRSWSIHPNSNPNSNSSLLLAKNNYHWYYRMCHKDRMYMSTGSAEEGVLVYSMEEDRWSTLSGSPFRDVCSDEMLYETRPYLGAWEDRIFAVLHDSVAESVTVWELIDVPKQEWVEFARCSKAQYEQLMFQDKLMGRCRCEIVSVFSEEYVLMYNWNIDESDALVLFNLKTKEWEPVASSPITFEEVEQSDEDDYYHDEDINCASAYVGDDDYGWSLC